MKLRIFEQSESTRQVDHRCSYSYSYFISNSISSALLRISNQNIKWLCHVKSPLVKHNLYVCCICWMCNQVSDRRLYLSLRMPGHILCGQPVRVMQTWQSSSSITERPRIWPIRWEGLSRLMNASACNCAASILCTCEIGESTAQVLERCAVANLLLKFRAGVPFHGLLKYYTDVLLQMCSLSTGRVCYCQCAPQVLRNQCWFSTITAERLVLAVHWVYRVLCLLLFRLIHLIHA